MASSESGGRGTPLLVLGGDLPTSAWGNPQAARETLRYLAAHPWVQPLKASDLQVLTPSPAPFSATSTTQAAPDNALLAALRQAPDNNASLAAWECFQSMYAPVSPPASKLPELRAHYAGLVWELLAAAQWAARPMAQASCDVDPDGDGQAECILASENAFILAEQNSGALSLAFARYPAETDVHQLIGPSSQFITGLSEPTDWRLDSSAQADPAVIDGAFAEPDLGYTGQAEAGELIFNSTDGQRRKIYRLTPNGFRLEYQGVAAGSRIALHLPLALDPWLRFYPGWADRSRQRLSSEGWSWQVTPGLKAMVQSSTPLKAQTFLDSRPFLGQTEDPNLDYPAGHFLIFPLALVDFSGQEDFYVEVNLLPPGE
jgi:hypothetical protein